MRPAYPERQGHEAPRPDLANSAVSFAAEGLVHEAINLGFAVPGLSETLQKRYRHRQRGSYTAVWPKADVREARFAAGMTNETSGAAHKVQLDYSGCAGRHVVKDDVWRMLSSNRREADVEGA